MRFRLLIDLDVVDFMQSLARSRRARFFAHFRQIREHPERHSDFVEHDDTGRRVDVSVLDGFAIYYWIDHADQHVKILKLVIADTG
jgi:hypothetical protein